MALIDKLSAVADAIRTKTGKSEKMTLSEMPAQIESIETGGGAELLYMLQGGITAISNDDVTVLRDYAFYMISKGFTAAHFPNVTSIGQYAFGSCNELADVYLPRLKTIGSNGFNCCFLLKQIDLPMLEDIQAGAFQYCKALEIVCFPNVKNVESRAFVGCESLTTVILPKLSALNTYAFQKCTALRTVDIGVGAIKNYTFNGCTALTALILRASTAGTLNGTNALTNTPIATGTGFIYVPSALLYSYKSQSGWSTYAAQFRALEDYTVDGTVTGALDEDKI